MNKYASRDIKALFARLKKQGKCVEWDRFLCVCPVDGFCVKGCPECLPNG